MAYVVRMPAVIAGASEAALQSWLVAVGDAVAAGQPIAEIETEKAVFEHEAEASGVVAGLLVAPGEAVAVGTPIAVLAQEGEDAAAALAAVAVSDPAASGGRAPRAAAPESDAAADASARSRETAVLADPGSNPGATAPRLFASPLVRRLARARGIELSSLIGTGPGGRIVRRDLERAAPPASDESERQTAGEWTEIPHTPMRRAIARRLTESVTTIPQFALVAECRVDALQSLRTAVNAERERPVSLNDLVVKAVGAALAAVPEANAIWTADAVRLFAHADVGVAVALDDGLVTPVVRGVDRMPLGELSEALHDLVQRARAGRLRQHEIEGGALSVSNLGMLGTREFTAIVNPPQSGILAVGAVERRAVVNDEGGLEAASVMTVTLSADHRVIDGALAARWLRAFRRFIENPVSMLV